MGKNVLAGLSAERKKGETMTPLVCKTRNLGLKVSIATKVMDKDTRVKNQVILEAHPCVHVLVELPKEQQSHWNWLENGYWEKVVKGSLLLLSWRISDPETDLP